MTKRFFHGDQHALVIACFEENHAIGMETGKIESGREQFAPA